MSANVKPFRDGGLWLSLEEPRTPSLPTTSTTACKLRCPQYKRAASYNDVCRFIPKGSTVFANFQWAVNVFKQPTDLSILKWNHERPRWVQNAALTYILLIGPPLEMFPEPEEFRPERFLETTDPRLKNFDLPFGFGRRSCPGIHLALNSLFINISRILWAFDIKPALDEQGKDIIPGM